MKLEIRVECFPKSVTPIPGEIGCYLVSSSRVGIEPYRVEIQSLRCGCKRDQTHGQRTRKQLGYYPHTHWCKHLRASMIYHGLLVTLAAAEQELNRGNQKQREACANA